MNQTRTSISICERPDTLNSPPDGNSKCWMELFLNVLKCANELSRKEFILWGQKQSESRTAEGWASLFTPQGPLLLVTSSSCEGGLWGTGGRRWAFREIPLQTAGLPKDCLQSWGEPALVGKESTSIPKNSLTSLPSCGFKFSWYMWSKHFPCEVLKEVLSCNAPGLWTKATAYPHEKNSALI